MSYDWEIEGGTFPIEQGTEVSWKHFETLRRMCFLKLNPYAGQEAYYNYYDPYYTPSTWSDYIATFTGVSFPWTYESSPYSTFFRVAYQTPDMSSPDLFTLNGIEIGSMSVLQNNPPMIYVNGEYVLNTTYWLYTVDYNRYSDFDQYSGRWIVRTYTAAAETFLSKVESWRYLPAQVGPKHQRTYAKYADTEREIPRLKYAETNYQHLTQPSSMGPKFSVTKIWEGGYYKWVKDGKVNAGLSGYDYAWDGGDPPQGGTPPFDALPFFGKKTNQHYYDSKLCAAFQSFIEYVCSANNWILPIDLDTPQGQEYKRNYDGAHNVGQTDPDELVNYNGTWPYPTTARMDDPFWGCNRSAFELALWLTTDYDWYWLGEKYYKPEAVMDRWTDVDRGIYTAQQMQGYCPLPDGCWRRTWQYSLGRPRYAGIMAPSSYSPPVVEYEDYQVSSPWPYWWEGIFTPPEDTPEDEADFLTENEIAGLAARHEPDAYYNEDTDDTQRRPAFELDNIRTILNQCWNALEQLRYLVFLVGVGTEYKQGQDQKSCVYRTSEGVYNYNCKTSTLFVTANNAALAAMENDTWHPHTYVGAPYYGWDISIGRSATGSCDTNPYYLSIVKDVACLYHKSRICLGDADFIDSFPRGFTVFIHIKIVPYVINRQPLGEGDARILPDLVIGVSGKQISIPEFDSSEWEDSGDIPARFWEWGGWVDSYGDYWCKGKIIAFPLDIGKAYIDGTGTYIDVEEEHPITSFPDINPLGTYGNTSAMVENWSGGQTLILETNTYIELGMEPPDSVFDDRRYVIFEDVAVDDELFDDDGILI
jgi:hypothetical protein